ncbi:MAG: hypothetical protein A2817_02020 [Candidatus Yanofskybacteria bacterium RIFCSPHIGHO2_01_FULL_39_8b]|uniref:Tetratricopeptide repeat protein n=1 Tax=Candidatus Yanofskybacteria bacterium RIFCSPHIGHO2_01_FULL_39_8b TaxID=1802659 RepID=A0A1F8EDJ3_9BACT|nr:MAG: hypothetical protein A2817_02020 [Candidatus Yanofskybacteria bacterium RIFCSPHIGHO2_01_FULL_39_8b]
MGLWNKLFGKKKKVPEKEVSQVVEQLKLEERQEPEKPSEPTLEEKLAGALEAKRYESASDIYIALGQYDKAAEMYVKANHGWGLREKHNIFGNAVSMLQKSGVTIEEAVTRVFSLYGYENEGKEYYGVIAMTAFLTDLKKKGEDTPERRKILLDLSAFMDSKTESFKHWRAEDVADALGDFYTACDNAERARETYLQGAAQCVSRDEYDRAINLRKKAGLSEAEAVSATAQEITSFYDLFAIAEKYHKILSEDARRHILKISEQCEEYDKGRTARVHELFGLKREAAELYVQAQGEDNLASGLKLYSELGDDRAVLDTIIKRCQGIRYDHHGSFEWALNQTTYGEERKDILCIQLQLLSSLFGGNLPSSQETATFLGY